jgi:hypothetical protein
MAMHYRWDDLPREELNPLIGRRLVSGERLMIAQVYLTKGAIAPPRADSLDGSDAYLRRANR